MVEVIDLRGVVGSEKPTRRSLDPRVEFCVRRWMGGGVRKVSRRHRREATAVELLKLMFGS